jgi:preprotein translocase subunit SecB
MAADEQVDNRIDADQSITSPQKIYIKDASFESPNAPKIFTEKWNPKLEVEVDHSADSIAEDTYDVVLKITATVTVEDHTAFLAEIQQAGIFILRGLKPEILQRRLNVYCINALFPYASANLDELVSKGGFPQLLLQPINFAAQYNKRLQQEPANAEGSVKQ